MPPESASDRTGFLLDPETERRIHAYAREVGITPADVVRRAFEEYEAAHDGVRPEGGSTAFDLLSRAGLIGCIRGGADASTDLATNPEHMEGFGGG